MPIRRRVPPGFRVRTARAAVALGLLLVAGLSVPPVRAQGPPPPDTTGASDEERQALPEITLALAEATRLEESARRAIESGAPIGWDLLADLAEVLDRIDRRIERLAVDAPAPGPVRSFGRASLATRRGILVALEALAREKLGPPPAGAVGPISQGGAPTPPPRPDPAIAPPPPSAPQSPPPPHLPPRQGGVPSPSTPVGLRVAAVADEAYEDAVAGRTVPGLLDDPGRARGAPRGHATPREALPLDPGESLVIATGAGTLTRAGVVDLRLALVGSGERVDRRVEIVDPALDEARRRLDRATSVSIPSTSLRDYLAEGRARARVAHGEVLELRVVHAAGGPSNYYFRLRDPASWGGVKLPVMLGVEARFPGASAAPPAFAVVVGAATGLRVALDARGRHHLDFDGWLGLAVPGARPAASPWLAPGVAGGVMVGLDGIASFAFGADFVNGAAVIALALTPAGWRRHGFSFGP